MQPHVVARANRNRVREIVYTSTACGIEWLRHKAPATMAKNQQLGCTIHTESLQQKGCVSGRLPHNGRAKFAVTLDELPDRLRSTADADRGPP